MSTRHRSMVYTDVEGIAYLVASGVASGTGSSSSERMALKTTKGNGMRVECRKERDRLDAINSNVIQDTACTDIGCPHDCAEDQDDEALVRFRAILNDVRVHEHDKDNGRDNEGKISSVSA